MSNKRPPEYVYLLDFKNNFNTCVTLRKCNLFVCSYSIHESRVDILVRDFLLGVLFWVPDGKAGNPSEDLTEDEDRAAV